MKNKKITIIVIAIVLAVGMGGSIIWALKPFSYPAKKNILINSSKKITAPTEEKVKIKTEKQSADSLNIIDKLVNWGFQKTSGRKIDTIIIHSSYDALGKNPYDVDGLVEEYKSYGVSPHYLIDREGNIYRLVPDEDIAYQAGAGRTPDGRTDVNAFSIGIEMMNAKTDKNTGVQYASLSKLLSYLEQKYKIKYVLGHDQIAPGRKTDPWNFDWNQIKSLVPAY